MKYKKSIIVIMLAIFLISIAAVSASDVNDAGIASGDDGQIELSQSGEVETDNLQTGEEQIVTQTDNDENLSSTDELDVGGVDEATYSNLSDEISAGGNVELLHDYYRCSGGESTIAIHGDYRIIDGRGAVIDMAGSTIRAFNVAGYGVTIKNLTIKNANFTGGGGTIDFTKLGIIENCNFVNNTASYLGGAVNFAKYGTVTNCNFDGNTASYAGGAVYFNDRGTVTNCNFTNNKAINDNGSAILVACTCTVKNCNFINNTAFGSGAVYIYDYDNKGSSTITNCNFADNSAFQAGAIHSVKEGTVADTCIFKTSSDSNFNIGISSPTLNVDNFTTFYGSGEKLTFDLKTNSSIPVTNGNILISVYYKNNNSWVGNYSRLSGEGWTVDLPAGCYYAIFDTEYAEFQPINRTITVTDGTTFWDLNRTINNNTNNIITLEKNYDYNSTIDSAFTEGIVINRAVTINGNGYTINANGKSRIFQIKSDNVVLENITFVNGNTTGDGGAVYFSKSGRIINCNFTNNSAKSHGGAIIFSSPSSTGTVTNCNFTDNRVTGDESCGGAVYFRNNGEVTNCNFTDNSARYCGAIRFMGDGTVTNCNFIDNNATYYGGAVHFWDEGAVENCNFVNNSASEWGGAIRFSGSGTVTNCNFTDNSAGAYGGAVFFLDNGDVTNCNFTGNNATIGSAIYFVSTLATKTVSNSRFLNNRANAENLEVTKNDNNITITFTGKDNLLNAIYSNGDVTFTNVTYWSANGIANTDSSTPVRSNKEAGQNITVSVVVNDKIVLNKVITTDENGMIVLDIIAGENYYISARHDTDSYYTEAETINSTMKFNVNVTSQTTNNRTVNITAKSNIPNEVIDGKLLFIVPNNDPINATYAGNGTWWALHTFDNAGDYKVNASYIGLDNVIINNATISIRFDASVDVNNKTLDLLIGDTFTVVATTTPEGLKVSFVPDDSGVYSIDENGNVIALRDGEGSILIKVGDDGIYAKNSTIVNVAVSKIPTNISVVPVSLELFVGDETVIDATLTPGDAGKVTFKSSDGEVVLVEDDGNVIANGKGQAIITVSFAGNDMYAAAVNKTINVTVKLNNANVTVDKDNLDLKVGETYQINATKSPDTILLDITYASSNTAVASVDKNGVVTAVGEGTAIITVSVGDDEIYAENSTNVTVSVSKVPTEITASDVTATYNINKDLVITLKDSTGKTLSGVKLSVDLNGAKEYTTDSNGQVKVPTKGLAPKTYTVKITFNGDTKYDKSTKEVKVTVKKATPKIIAKKKTYKAKATKKFTITLKDNKGKPIKKAKVRLFVKKIAKKTKKTKTTKKVKKNIKKTNKKGKATFKIDRTKKGKYWVTVKFYGNKYFKAITKKVKITIK